MQKATSAAAPPPSTVVMESTKQNGRKSENNKLWARFLSRWLGLKSSFSQHGYALFDSDVGWDWKFRNHVQKINRLHFTRLVREMRQDKCLSKTHLSIHTHAHTESHIQNSVCSNHLEMTMRYVAIDYLIYESAILFEQFAKCWRFISITCRSCPQCLSTTTYSTNRPNDRLIWFPSPYYLSEIFAVIYLFHTLHLLEIAVLCAAIFNQRNSCRMQFTRFIAIVMNCMVSIETFQWPTRKKINTTTNTRTMLDGKNSSIWISNARECVDKAI